MGSLFGEDAEPEEEEDLGLNDLFKEEEEEEDDLDYDISSLFNEGAGGAGGSDLPSNLAKQESTESTAIEVKIAEGIANGALLLGEFGQKMKVEPGQAVQIVVNPAVATVDGKQVIYKLTDGSLQVTYTAGGETKTEALTADRHGRYFYTIPTGASNISFTITRTAHIMRVETMKTTTVRQMENTPR